MNIIEKSAKLIGDIQLGENNYIGHNTVIIGPVKIGNNNKIFHNVVIGTPSQHLEINQDSTSEFNSTKYIEIGDNNVIREFTTIHKPMHDITFIKNNCFIMAYNHISHDMQIHNNVIMANNCQIGGHTKILKNANIGLSAVVHQYSTIGSYSMVGMGTIITKDVAPFLKVIGNPIKILGINEIGMKRCNFTNEDIEAARQIIHIINKSNGDIDYVKFENEKINSAWQEFLTLRNPKRKLAYKLADQI